jgi:hypothetical protein
MAFNSPFFILDCELVNSFQKVECPKAMTSFSGRLLSHDENAATLLCKAADAWVTRHVPLAAVTGTQALAASPP